MSGHELRTITRPSERTVRRVLDEARGLSPEDDRLTDRTGQLGFVSDPLLSTFLFDADVVDAVVRDGTVRVDAQHGVTFPEGDGWLSFVVRADADTLDVESVKVGASLF